MSIFENTINVCSSFSNIDKDEGNLSTFKSPLLHIPQYCRAARGGRKDVDRAPRKRKKEQ